MNRAEFHQSSYQQERLRTLVAFMGRTANYEQAIRRATTLPYGIPGIPNSDRLRARQEEALRSSYAVISEGLRSLGGVDYIAAHPDTHEPIAFHLTGWHGSAPDQPNYHIWDVQLASETETISIRGDYLNDLWRNINESKNAYREKSIS